MIQPQDITSVIMAKYPEPGMVKTRLIGGVIDAEGAARIAEAMLRCVVFRSSRLFGRTLLATDSDAQGRALGTRLGMADLPVLVQGTGTLGQRIERVWRHLDPRRPVAFFGIDCPDVPSEFMSRIPAALETNEAAVGPTEDGGYWTMAARSFQPELVRNIDWGSEFVYDQTRQRATEAGVSLYCLPSWKDVDDLSDLLALRQRLARANERESEDAEPFETLARRLTDMIADS